MFKFLRIPNKPSSFFASELFPNEDSPGEYTWEQWERDSKLKYPVRYWLTETLPFWVSTRILRSIKDFSYWLTSHLIPSRKYHLLDLRQPKSLPEEYQYRYGWIDSDSQMLYACFNILCNYVENELGEDSPVKHEFTEEELNDPQDGELNRNFKSEYDEIKTIYHWWKVDRLVEKKRCSEALTTWYDAHSEARHSEKEQQLYNELHTLDAGYATKEEEMLIRLIKIRGRMWT